MKDADTYLLANTYVLRKGIKKIEVQFLKVCKFLFWKASREIGKTVNDKYWQKCIRSNISRRHFQRNSPYTKLQDCLIGKLMLINENWNRILKGN